MDVREAHIRVWDVPVRLFHWLLVLLFAFMFLSGKLKGDWMEWHMRSGYTILALVLFRILWGFAGSTYARFSNFLAGPSAGIAFARKLLARAPAHSAGHNPLGGWMVVALLIGLTVQTVTGLFANDDIMNEGPLMAWVDKDLSDTLSGVHTINFVVLLSLISVHVLAIVYHRLRKGEHLTLAMITGRRMLPGAPPTVRTASPWLAAVLLALSAGMVAVLINL